MNWVLYVRHHEFPDEEPGRCWKMNECLQRASHERSTTYPTMSIEFGQPDEQPSTAQQIEDPKEDHRMHENKQGIDIKYILRKNQKTIITLPNALPSQFNFISPILSLARSMTRLQKCSKSTSNTNQTQPTDSNHVSRVTQRRAADYRFRVC